MKLYVFIICSIFALVLSVPLEKKDNAEGEGAKEDTSALIVKDNKEKKSPQIRSDVPESKITQDAGKQMKDTTKCKQSNDEDIPEGAFEAEGKDVETPNFLEELNAATVDVWDEKTKDLNDPTVDIWDDNTETDAGIDEEDALPDDEEFYDFEEVAMEVPAEEGEDAIDEQVAPMGEDDDSPDEEEASLIQGEDAADEEEVPLGSNEDIADDDDEDDADDDDEEEEPLGESLEEDVEEEIPDEGSDEVPDGVTPLDETVDYEDESDVPVDVNENDAGGVDDSDVPLEDIENAVDEDKDITDNDESPTNMIDGKSEDADNSIGDAKKDKEIATLVDTALAKDTKVAVEYHDAQLLPTVESTIGEYLISTDGVPTIH